MCPVAKELVSKANPAMIMPCGHVICQESLAKLTKNNGYAGPPARAHRAADATAPSPAHTHAQTVQVPLLPVRSPADAGQADQLLSGALVGDSVYSAL